MVSRWYLALVGAVAAERLFELWLSAHNRERMQKKGAVEHGQGHYPAMVLMQVSFLIACVAEVAVFHRRVPGGFGAVMVCGVVLAQLLRYWAVITLGDRWNTRILVLQGVPPVAGGPYRFLRHPNYLAVVIETLCLPLSHGAWLTALVFSLVNALLLRVRITAEERALGDNYARTFYNRRRLWPRISLP